MLTRTLKIGQWLLKPELFFKYLHSSVGTVWTSQQSLLLGVWLTDNRFPFCRNSLLCTCLWHKGRSGYPLLFLAGNWASVATSCLTQCALRGHPSCPFLTPLVLTLMMSFSSPQPTPACFPFGSAAAVWCIATSATHSGTLTPHVMWDQVGSGEGEVCSR